jgi:hypothetical protein
MLKINVNEEKQLTFEVQIGGIQSDQIKSHFKIIINEVEYGFPAIVGNETIKVNLPPLNRVVGTKIKEGDEAEVRLEVVADGHYLTPWQDQAKLSNPLVVEAVIKDDGFTPNPSLQTRLVVSEDGARQKAIVEEKRVDQDEDLTEKIVNRLADKLSSLVKKEQDDKMLVEPDPKAEEEEEKEEEVEEKCKVRKEQHEQDIQDKSQALEKLLDKTIDAYNLNENRSSKKKMTLQEFKQNLSKKDIINYIAKKGTKNPKIQEVIYEQAALNADKDEPVYILKQVIDILKKK